MGFFDDYAPRHPSVTGVLRFLEFDHLRNQRARDVSAGFANLARDLLAVLPDDPELVIALRKLREAKDVAVGLAVLAYPVANDEPEEKSER